MIHIIQNSLVPHSGSEWSRLLPGLYCDCPHVALDIWHIHQLQMWLSSLGQLIGKIMLTGGNHTCYPHHPPKHHPSGCCLRHPSWPASQSSTLSEGNRVMHPSAWYMVFRTLALASLLGHQSILSNDNEALIHSVIRVNSFTNWQEQSILAHRLPTA